MNSTTPTKYSPGFEWPQYRIFHLENEKLEPPFTAYNDNKNLGTYSWFLHDVMAAMLALPKKETAGSWCPRLIFGELSSIHLQSFSFVSVEKHGADYGSENQQLLCRFF